MQDPHILCHQRCRVFKFVHSEWVFFLKESCTVSTVYMSAYLHDNDKT